MKTFFSILFVHMALYAYAQVNENFNDGDFLYDPQWFGDTANFIVNDSLQLQLMAPEVEATSYLATASEAINDATWELSITMDFKTSSTSYTKAYLVADKQNLKAALNGYFVKAGDTDDDVCLYVQNGTSVEKIIDGKDKRIDQKPVNLRIKVTRSSNGVWHLYSDTTGGKNYYHEGTTIDTTHFRSYYFGLFCEYTKTRYDEFYFDDISITGYPYIDTIPPSVDSLALVSDSEIQLLFSEKLDSLSATDSKNYLLDHECGNPDSVILAANKKSVRLYFNSGFSNATGYTIDVSGVKDVDENIMLPESICFTYYLPKPYDVVFNEIMADPTPSVGLPEYEYLEIYNTTAFDIDLTGWQLIIGDNQRTITSGMIKSNDYLIITNSTAKNAFDANGKTMDMLYSTTALLNSGQLLRLKDNRGTTMHTIEYTNHWYNDDYKADGGWSLEQIDPKNPCGAEQNWTAAKNRKGGTPGAVNSVNDNNPDFSGPLIRRIAYTSDTSIKVFFNEYIDSSSIVNHLNYTVDHGIGHPVKVIASEPLIKSAILIFDQSFIDKTIYTLTVKSKIADCLGNTLEGNNTLRFGVPHEADSIDVVINEVLFNPLLDGVDFVELYNRSGKTIDMAKLRIGTKDKTKGTLKDVMIITEEGYLLFPGEYIVLTTNPEKVLSHYYTRNPDNFITTNKLPAYNNDKGDVVITDYALKTIDDFAYSENMHFSLLKNKKGVSLERIHYNRPTNDENNWHSAAETIGFATPAYKNSQFNENPETNNPITIKPKIFSPDNDGYHDILNICYNFKKEGNTGSIVIFNNKGQIIRHLATNHLFGTEGIIKWDGINDQGNRAPLGIYIIFVEIFNTRGDVKQYKQTCVLGGRL